MSHSSHVFTLIPPGYEKLADMMRARQPIEKCIKKLVQLMHDDELAVFHHHLSLEDYFASIEKLKTYFLFQQKIQGTPPSLVENSVCPVFANYQQIIHTIDKTIFTFIKDFYQWQPLALALHAITEFEKPFQQALILTADMPLAAYLKEVKQSFLHWQQTKNGAISVNEWLLHFTHVLAQQVETSSEEKASQLAGFQKQINDLISRWHHYHQLLQDQDNVITPEMLQAESYATLPTPSVEAVNSYEPAEVFAAPYVEPDTANSFAAALARFGLLFTLSTQLGRAAGMAAPVAASSAVCLAGEEHQSALVNPLQLMTTQHAALAAQPARYPKTSPENQIIPDHVFRQTPVPMLQAIDSAILKRTEHMMIAARSVVPDVPKDNMNAHQLAIAHLGINKHPVAVFKHFQVYESPELGEDNYMFLSAAAIEAPETIDIPEELFATLKQNLDKKHPEAGRIIREIRDLHKGAIYHVMTGYLYSNGVLAANSRQAYEWAQIAAKLGNVHALQYLGERIYPYPDRDYALLMSDIRTTCPSTAEEMASEKAGYLRESENYLRCAAYYGHARASYLLGEAYQWGYYGVVDKEKALSYYVQSIIQTPKKSAPYRGAIQAAISIIDNVIKQDKKFEQLSWQNFNAHDYFEFYKKVSKAVKILMAVVELADEALTKRVLYFQRENAAIFSADTQIGDESIKQIRAALQTGKAKLKALTLELDTEHVLPSPANLMEFGVFFESRVKGKIIKIEAAAHRNMAVNKIRELSAVASVEAAKKLGEMYAAGFLIKQNRDIASFFFRQAMQIQPELALTREMHLMRIQNEEAKLLPHLELAMRVAQNPFRGTARHMQLVRLPAATARRYGIQIPSIMKPVEWSAEVIHAPQIVTSEDIERLQHDILQKECVPSVKYQRIVSALRDGDYTDIAQIISFYEGNVDRQFVWISIAASHGHLPSLRLLGRALRTNALMIGANQSDLHVIGISHTALAASLGDFDATIDMIDIVENNELNIDPLGVPKADLIWFYKSQCYRQDSKRTLAMLVDESSDNALQRAKYADGINRRFRYAGEDLAWHPVRRDGSDDNVKALFALLEKHHPNAEAVQEINRQFQSGDSKCFMHVAQYYMVTDIPEMSTMTRQLLSVSWAVLAFRSGDTEAAATIYGVSLNLKDQYVLPAELVALFNRIYTDVYPDSVQPVKTSIAEQLNHLAADSICFSAYYHDSLASVIHAKLKSNMEISGWNGVNTLSQGRALLAQAVMQGRNDWRIYYDLSQESLRVLELIKQESSAQLTKDLRFLVMEEFLFEEHLSGLRQMIDLAMLKLQLEYAQFKQADVQQEYDVHAAQIKMLHTRLARVAGYSLAERYRAAGVELNQDRKVFDGLHRVHQPWERDIVAALRSPDFSIEQQYYLRSKTLVKLKKIKHDYLIKLAHGMFDNPADMLNMHELCVQQGEVDLAVFWLKAAARAGDTVAHRMILIQQTHTYSELAVLAAHGEAGASEMLAESENTPNEFRMLLRAQAARVKRELGHRDLHLPAQVHKIVVTERVETPADHGWYYKYILTMFVAITGLLLALYGKKRVDQSRKNEEKIAAQKQKEIENLLTHFRAFPRIACHYDSQLAIVVAAFQAQQAPKLVLRSAKQDHLSVLQCAEEDKQKAIDPLLQRATLALRHAKIIGQHEALSEEAILALLGIKVSRSKKSEYFYKLTNHNDIRVEYDAGIERELFAAYVTMSGFSLAYQQDDVCHLQALNQQAILDAPVKLFCSAVCDLILHRHHQKIEHEKLEAAERLAQQQAEEKKYQTALASLKKYDAVKVAELKSKLTALRDDMLSVKVKLAGDVANLCDELIIKLDKCQAKIDCEDREEVVLFEESITRGILLLHEKHDLRKRVKEEVEHRQRHAVEKAARNLEKYDGTKKRADKARQAEEARKQTALKQEAAKAKKQEVQVAAAPAPVAVVAEKPAAKVTVVRDIAEVDFSKMKVLTPKSSRLFAPAAAPRRPVPPTIRSLVIEPELEALIQREERDWPFDLIDHHRSLLNEILTDIAFEPKSCEKFRLRALSFRLMRYLLFLESLNKEGGNEVNVPAIVRNHELRKSLKRFVTGIKHNFHLIELHALEACVRKCFLANTDDISAVIRDARRSPLCAAILPRHNNVVIPRSEATIFTELGTYFDELKAIDGLYNKLAMSKKLDDACHDGYRGVIMMIGEVGQWLYQTCPQLKNEIFANYPELREFMYFIVMCHVLHRNNYAHVMDLTAMYESSLADFPFVVDKLFSVTLFRFVARGIKIGCDAGLCERLKSAYIATKQKRAEGNNNNKPQDHFEQELKHDYISMLDLHMGESDTMTTQLSPRNHF